MSSDAYDFSENRSVRADAKSFRQRGFAERQACAGIQDYRDDLTATVREADIQSDLQRAGRAANRGTKAKLASDIAAARKAVSTAINAKHFTNALGNRVDAAIARAAHDCRGVGLPPR